MASIPKLHLPKTSFLAAGVFGLALVMSLQIARATHPPGYFLKYIDAAMTSNRDELRVIDYSPLYLLFAKVVVPIGGKELMLWLQCLMHAIASAAIFLVVETLAGRGWALGAGLAAATYRPFLVYAGVLEPEIPVVTVLALALCAGIAARNGMLGSRSLTSGWRTVCALCTGSALGLAVLLRPHYLVLLPIWALWVSSGVLERPNRRLALFVLASGILVIAPAWMARPAGSRSSVGMNPGTVFYEGNNPAVSSPVETAPDFVKLIELSTPGQPDVSHIVYRRIAEAVRGRSLTPNESNAFWSGLALEWIRARPLRALRLAASKLIAALAPFESHDLLSAVELDRRVSTVLPWGFGIFLFGIPSTLLLPRSRVGELVGPLALALLILVVQVAFYPSARQRLPLALALLIALPVALLELGKIPKSLAFAAIGAGIISLGTITGISGEWAAEQEATFFPSPGPDASRSDIRFASILDGSAFHPGIMAALTRLNQGQRLYRTGHWEQAMQTLEPLAAGRITQVRQFRARASYWMAKCYLARGQLDLTRAMASSANALQPDDLRTQALVTVLSDSSEPVALARRWRPPGYDEFSARMALAREVSFTGHPEAATQIALPVAAHFPEIRGIIWP